MGSSGYTHEDSEAVFFGFRKVEDRSEDQEAACFVFRGQKPETNKNV